MTPEAIAAHLYHLNLTETDRVQFSIKMMQLLAGANLGEVEQYYERIKLGLLTLVTVTTAYGLTEDYQKDMEAKLKVQFPKKHLVFIYIIDQDFPTAIEIRVGDDLIDFSFD